MNDMIDPNAPGAENWAKVLAESEAELENGLLVSGDAMIRELWASVHRLENAPSTPVDAEGLIASRP